MGKGFPDWITALPMFLLTTKLGIKGISSSKKDVFYKYKETSGLNVTVLDKISS